MAFFIDNQTPVVVDLLAHLLYLNVSHVTGSTTFWCQLSVNLIAMVMCMIHIGC